MFNVVDTKNADIAAKTTQIANPVPQMHWISSNGADGGAASGDFVECIALDAHRCAVIVGDIAGRGSDASGAADRLRIYVKSLVVGGHEPEFTLAACDEFFARRLGSARNPFATLFVALIDRALRTMSFASAGHETAILFGSGKKHTHLSPTGPILGIGTGATTLFVQRRLSFKPGGLFVAVTDGITDARPAKRYGSFFGSNGVVEAVADARASGVDPAEAVRRAAAAHADGALNDDASVIALAS
jgi:serine phosphatase RsbU (regulator of sigma subunit)